VPSEIVGPGTRDVCSNDALVTVPLRGAPGDYRRGKLVLATRRSSTRPAPTPTP
jgi:hypothetical protein